MTKNSDKIKYVQLEPSAFLSDPDVQSWDDKRIGCYVMLIFYLYCNDGKFNLTSDSKMLARLCHCYEGWDEVWTDISGKFYTKNYCLRHKRVDIELDKARKWQAAKSYGGKMGAAKRWHSHNTPITDLSLTYKTPIDSPITTITKETITKDNIRKENNTNTNIGSSTKDDVGVVVSSDFDLVVEEKCKWFCREIAKIFNPTQREAVTFARVATHIKRSCVKPYDIEIFTKALVWAKKAKASTARNKIGLWMAKVKKETGFKGTTKLL